MSGQFNEEGQAGSCLCPLSLPKDAAHGQGTGQSTSDLVQQGLLWGSRRAWEWRHGGCGGSGSTHLRVAELQVPKISSTASLCPAHIKQPQREGQWLHTPPELSQACLFRGAAQQTAWAPASLELSAPNQEPTAQRALQHLARGVTPEAVPERFYLSSLQLPRCTHVQPTHRLAHPKLL